jgi:hypothetical protein
MLNKRKRIISLNKISEYRSRIFQKFNIIDKQHLIFIIRNGSALKNISLHSIYIWV